MSRTTHPMSPPDEESGTEPTRSGPYVVPGTLLVAYLMATGRWGSHFGWWQQGIYVTDIALVVTAAWSLLRHRSAMRWDRARWVLLAPFVLIPAWALARLVVNWRVDQEALRDLAPFVYVLVGLVALVDVSRDARRRTLVVLEVALVLHAVWVAASTYLDIETRYPLSGGLLYVFEIRSDFDCAMLAVLAALSLQRVVRARRLWERVPAAFIMLACPYLIFQTGSRAGGLALVVAVLLSALSMLRSIPVSRTQLLVGIGLVLAVIAVALPQTSLYGRLTGADAAGVNSAAGTTSAREEAWVHVLEYTSSSPVRAVFGVGPGPDFLVDSGARRYFGQVHQGDIRVPHNIFLSYYARLGLVGLTLFLALLVPWVRASWAVVSSGRSDTLSLTYVLTTATLLLTSLLGVVLESPFGAVPFAWMAGQLIMGSSRRRRTTGVTSD